MKKLSFIFFIQVLASTFAFADLPYEIIYINRENLPKELFRNSIGIITLNSGIRAGNSLVLYDNDFKVIKRVNLRDESKPISNFGYHPPFDSLISNYRYLIIAENESYVKIVPDFNVSKSFWISKKEINQKFFSEIKYLNKLQTKSSEFLSLFDITDKDKRELYISPSELSDHILISREDYKDKLLKIVDQKGDFIKVAIVVPNSQMQKEEIGDVIGWIKIKDNDGTLNVWITMIDLFS